MSRPKSRDFSERARTLRTLARPNLLHEPEVHGTFHFVQGESLGAEDRLPRAWEVLAFLVTVLFMLWPVAINQAPFYASDSASYIRGGELGFKTGELIIEQWLLPAAPSKTTAKFAVDPNAIVADAIAKSGGARSAIYSVAAYLLRAPGNSLLALAIFQAAIVAFMICCLRHFLAPGSRFWPSIGASGAIALLTSASWYSVYAMPDILAGVGISASLVLTVFFERVRTSLRVALLLLIAFCITAHGSHLPIVVLSLAAGAAASSRLGSRTEISLLPRAAWFAGPVLLATVAMLATSYIAFGEFSLAPKRYPIQLARSVADGPGAWYLHDHCAIEHYAVCEVFGPNPPREVHDFLWGPNGVRYRATPDQMDRIRAEEGTIVRRAALAYPAEQIGRSLGNGVLQLLEFGPGDLVFGQRMSGAERVSPVQVSLDRPGLRAAGKILTYASFIGSVVFLAIIRRRLTIAEISALGVVAAGLLANAAVCGALSGVADRYQGRVAWVLPAVAVMILLRVRGRRSRPATSAKVMLA
jgi:hypothetical protein